MDKTIERRAMHWAMGHDTGISSKAIMQAMMGLPARDGSSHPRDPSDFGRCYRLLKLIPEWRGRLGEMASVSDEWAALVEHWAELEGMWLHVGTKIGDPKSRQMYDRMRAILKPIEAKRGNVFRFGDMTMEVVSPTPAAAEGEG